jgi:hypothetical protein
MKILIGCERSGVVRNAFRSLGYDAYSCDLVDSEDGSRYHLKCDIRKILADGWRAAIFFPDCTYLNAAGLHWNKRGRGSEKTDSAIDFVKLLMSAPIQSYALENPVGCIGTRIRPADQYIQPYEYGHDASKRTGLWLKDTPLLAADPKEFYPPRLVEYGGKTVPRWGNQTDSGQNRLGPDEGRAMARARTYEGVAKAMAKQWGAAWEERFEI